MFKTSSVLIILLVIVHLGRVSLVVAHVVKIVDVGSRSDELLSQSLLLSDTLGACPAPAFALISLVILVANKPTLVQILILMS